MTVDTAAVVTWDELSNHCKVGDLWVAVDGVAYDLTAWAEAHPGGPLVLERSAGKDMSEAFHAYHPAYVSKMLKKFKVRFGKTGTWGTKREF